MVTAVAIGCDASNSHQAWAARIAAAAVLPDQRLNSRLAIILKTLACQPNDSIPQAAGTWSRAKGMYRFFQNERFTHAPLVKAVADITVSACADHDRVYLLHDSSSLNYSSLKETTGLG